MKKILMMLLVGVLVLGAVGCSTKETSEDVYDEAEDQEVDNGASDNEDVDSETDDQNDVDGEDSNSEDVDGEDSSSEDVDDEEETMIEGTLEEIMNAVYSDLGKEFPLMQTVIEGDNIAYFLGTDDLTFVEALGSEPMMSSIAHSVALIRVEEGTDIDDMKAKIKENVDPRKWICVGVEEDEVIVDHIGDLIILIMDKEADMIHESFMNLAK